MIENNHQGDWRPEKDCCWLLTFRQPVRKPFSESNEKEMTEDGFRTGCREVSRKHQSFTGLQSPDILNQGILTIIKPRSYLTPFFPVVGGDF